MELHITIQLQGDAFEQHPDIELRAVLDRVQRSIDRHWHHLEPGDSGSALDTNGNTVATWEVQ